MLPAFTGSFASEIRYFLLKYTKYSCEKLPFSAAKSLAECLTPIYVVLPYFSLEILVVCRREKLREIDSRLRFF